MASADRIDEDCIIALIDAGWFDAANLKLEHAIAGENSLSDMIKIKATTSMF